MNPISAAVARPYTVAVAVILTLLFGVLALRNIPVQLKPTVDTPRITVSTSFRGASAIEVEEQITRELEDVLQGAEGLVEIVSDSSQGRSSITLEYDYGTNTDAAVVDVINRLSRVPSLPDEADEPEVEIVDGVGPNAIMWLTIRSGYDANRVRRIVEEEIEARLERISGVASLFIAGGSEREVRVEIDPERMVGLGVTFDELRAALSRGNVNLRGGTLETAGRQLAVRTLGRAERAADLEERIVRETPSGNVRLGDVARVIDGYREAEGFVNIMGVPGVAIGVQRKQGANVVAIIREVTDALVDLNDEFANRGLDVRLEVTFRETTYIDAALGFVTDNLIFGAGLAVIVLLVFLRSPRSVLIVAASLPVSLIAVFIVMQAAGRTLNVISLAGIAFASGMVVDNAIVVLENVYRHLEMGKTPRRAAVDGGREVWGGVLASTLTTIAVFVPIILEQDEASQLFRDIALSISAAVAFSLVVALTVVPVLSALLLRERSAPADGSQPGVGRVGIYGRLIQRLAARWPGSMFAKLGFVLLVAAASLAVTGLTPPAEYLPTGNRNMILFLATPIAGTRMEAVAENIRPLEEFVLAQEETERIFAVNTPFFQGGGVVLKPEFSDAQSLASYYGRMFGPAGSLAGFQFVLPIRSSIFEDPGKQFEVELSGPDLEVLEVAAEELRGKLMAVPGVGFARSSLVTGKPELRVQVDEARARELGLSVASIGEIVETVVAGRRTTALVDGGREVEINVVGPQDLVSSPEELEALRFVVPGRVNGSEGARAGGDRIVSLGAVARVERAIGPQSVRRLERERNVLLTVNIADEAPLEAVVEAVETDVFPATLAALGPAYSVRVGGSADKLRTTLESLSGGFGLSVLIIYLLLVALFRSWGTPFVILTTVPLALAGGVIGIRVAHEFAPLSASFDVISMLGFVILAGLVVNNAILIVHQTNNFRAEGLGPREALAESARSRLRPILMSVITTVSAMMPLALGGGAGAELYQGLGAVIVGGLLVSTVFTLILVPVLYSLGFDVVEALGSLSSRGAARRTDLPATG